MLNAFRMVSFCTSSTHLQVCLRLPDGKSHRLQPGTVLGVDMLIRRVKVPCDVRVDANFEAHIASMTWADYQEVISSWGASQLLALVPGLQFSVEQRLRAAIKQGGRVLRKDAGEAVYRQGDTADELVLLNKGQVLVLSEQGPDVLQTEGQLVSQLHALMGENPALVPTEMPKPSTAGTVRASEAGSLLTTNLTHPQSTRVQVGSSTYSRLSSVLSASEPTGPGYGYEGHSAASSARALVSPADPDAPVERQERLTSVLGEPQDQAPGDDPSSLLSEPSLSSRLAAPANDQGGEEDQEAGVAAVAESEETRQADAVQLSSQDACTSPTPDLSIPELQQEPTPHLLTPFAEDASTSNEPKAQQSPEQPSSPGPAVQQQQPHETFSGRQLTLAPIQVPPPLGSQPSTDLGTPMAGVVTHLLLLPTSSVAAPDMLPAHMNAAAPAPGDHSSTQRAESDFLFTVPDPAAAAAAVAGSPGAPDEQLTPLLMLRPSALPPSSETPASGVDLPSPDLIHVTEPVLPEHAAEHPAPHPALTHPSTPASSEQYASTTTSPGPTPLPVSPLPEVNQQEMPTDAHSSSQALHQLAPQHSIKSKLGAEPGPTLSTRSSGAGASVTSVQGKQAPSSETDLHSARQGSDVAGWQAKGSSSRGQQQQQQTLHSSRPGGAKGTSNSKTSALAVPAALPAPVVKGIPLYNALATAIKGNRQSVVAAYSKPIFLAEEGLSSSTTMADRSVVLRRTGGWCCMFS
jgi:hypothetical protein